MSKPNISGARALARNDIKINSNFDLKCACSFIYSVHVANLVINNCFNYFQIDYVLIQ